MLLKFSIFSLLAATGSSTSYCGTITGCYLVNLDESAPSNVIHATGTKLVPGAVTNYHPNDSVAGFSIFCETNGKVDYSKYFLSGNVNTQYDAPFWARGDNSGSRVNPYRELSYGCGEKDVTFKSYTWENGDDFPCETMELSLNAVCEPVVPASPTCQKTAGGCGSGEQCCDGLTCQWADGGHRRCFPPPLPTCQITAGGCGSGEQCCDGLTCQWTDGGHRRCLPPPLPTCQKTSGGCGGGEQCCDGLTCQWTDGGHRRCLPPPFPTCQSILGICEQPGSMCCGGLTCQETYGHRRICMPPNPNIPGVPYVCEGTHGGCGGGEKCCEGVTCEWSPGNHRTCLPPCSSEDKSCSTDGECCSGLSCQGGRCLKAHTIKGCDCKQPDLGVIKNGECVNGHISGTCVSACCTNCRLTTRYTPIALDMDGSGLVERVSNLNVKFDINNNGELEELHEWFAPSEGILVDTNVPGEHLTGAHLFGDEGGKYKNGFVKLGRYDANKDGLLTGDELNGLMLWFDANTNAYLDSNEVKELSEFDIVSLSLHEESMVGHATKIDGRQIRMEDLWLDGDNIKSIVSLA